MKKEGFLIILLLLGISLNLLINLHEKGMEKITAGSIIDTMATFSVSIQVDAGPPNVIINSPTNRTYFSGNNLPLNYIATDTTGLDTVWYNLDNGNNITLTDNTIFNANEGSHTLYIFANDTIGFLNNSEYISFSVGIPSETKTTNGGGYVEHDDPAIRETLTRIANLPTNLEVNITYYNETIPTGWAAPSSSTVETALKYFEITVNESTSGTISFNLTNAELGSTSPSDIRLFRYDTSWTELTTTVVDSSSDPLSFSAATAHFSQFIIGKKAEAETPAPTGGAVSGSSGGGGGGGTSIGPSFSLDQGFIKVSLKKGDMLTQPIRITNTGSDPLNFIVDLQGLSNVLFVSDPSFTLKKGEAKTVNLDVITGKGVAPGVYIGDIMINAGSSILKIIKTIIEIESEKVLFDISLDIPSMYKQINPGEELILHSTLLNMGGLNDVNVTIEYAIKDSSGKEILKDKESIVVGTQATFTKKFIIPKDTAFGEYVIFALVKYKDSVGTSSEIFTVGKTKEGINIWNISLIVGVLLLLVLMSLWQRKRFKKIEKKTKESIKELKEKKPSLPKEQKESLNKELELLEKSYREGYITKDAFIESKEKITKQLK